MKSSLRWLVPAYLPIALGLCAQQPGNLTGNWYLNVDKSEWGSAKKLQDVVLHIEHKEPALRYSGSVTYLNEDTRGFTFDGAIDGKAYPMTRSYGSGTVVLRRIDALTFESVFRTNDNAYVENVRSTLSRGGRDLTRRVRLETPQGSTSWTEIYERH